VRRCIVPHHPALEGLSRQQHLRDILAQIVVVHAG
jgi:hypothetical protein